MAEIGAILLKADKGHQPVGCSPTSQLPPLLFWLFMAEEQRCMAASESLSEAASRLTGSVFLGAPARAQILKNMECARQYGLFTPEGLDNLRAGGPLVVRRGPFANQSLTVSAMPIHTGAAAGREPGSWETLELQPAPIADSARGSAFWTGVISPSQDSQLPQGAIRVSRHPVPPRPPSLPPPVLPPPVVANQPPAPNFAKVTGKLNERIKLDAWGIRAWDVEVRSKTTLEIQGALVSKTNKVHIDHPPVPGSAYLPAIPGYSVDCPEVKIFTVPARSGVALAGVEESACLLYKFPNAIVYLLEAHLSDNPEQVRLLVQPIDRPPGE